MPGGGDVTSCQLSREGVTSYCVQTSQLWELPA